MKSNRFTVLVLVALALILVLGQSAAVGAQPSPINTAHGQSGGSGVGPDVPSPSPTPCGPGMAPWTTKSPIPAPTDGYRLAAVTSDGTLAYAAGGKSTSTGFLSQFSAYHPITDTWTTLAPMADANFGATAVYDPIGNKIYVFGGFNSTYSNQTRIYDVASNTWSLGTSMPNTRVGMAGGYYNGSIYLVSGYGGSPAGFKNQVWVYNINNNSFTTPVIAGTPTLDLAGAAMINGHLYLAGGFNSGGPLNTLWDFNIAASTWTQVATLPMPLKSPAAANVNGRLWIFGGGSAGGGTDDGMHTYIYDPASNMLTAGPSLNSPHYFTAGTSVGPYAVVIGGASDAAGTTSTPVTEVSYNAGNPCLTATPTVTGTPPTATPTATPCGAAAFQPWVQKAPAPTAAFGGSAATDNSVVYYAGGFSAGTTATSQFAKYDPVASTWTALNPMPTAVGYESTAYDPTGNQVLAFGGDNGGTFYDKVQVYNVANGTWNISGVTMPGGPIDLMASGYYNGVVYLVGGSPDGATTISRTLGYNIASSTFITNLANLPVTLAAASATIINGHLYVAGGVAGGVNATNLYDYNIAANTWTQRSSLPATSALGAGATVNGGMWVFGDIINPTGTVIYDPSQDNWLTGPNLLQPQAEAAGTSVMTNSLTYVVAVGGQGSGGASTTTEVSTNPPSSCSSPTPIVTATPTASITPTSCAVPFTDIGGDIFATAIQRLYCVGVVNGTSQTTFSPHGTSTRGQFAKVVVLAFGTPFFTPNGSPDFTDVQPSSFAYVYVETGFHANILSGYDSATCLAAGITPPCYLPNRPITRGQLTKLVVGAAHYPLFTPSSGQTFIDVPPSNVFFPSIETAHSKGIINGYPGNLFLPNQAILRDQMCQIVYVASITP